MATNAGKILVTPKGDYNPATEYKILDTVRYGGKTWVCKQICTGQTPAISAYWDIWCEDGIDGEDGADGSNTYTYIRYSASADGTGFVDTPTSSTIYIGFYAGTSATAPTDKTEYTWSKYVGESGSGTGDMLASVYATNGTTGVVDTSNRLRQYVTRNSGTTYSNQWTKIATVTFTSAYQIEKVIFSVINRDDDYGAGIFSVTVRVGATVSTHSNATLNCISANKNFKTRVGTLKIVYTTPIYELWFKPIDSFSELYISVLNESYRGPGFTWLENQPYQATQPSGTVVTATLMEDYLITDLTAETAIADADYFMMHDTSAVANRKTLWSNIKSVLKAYFDTLYNKTASTTVKGGVKIGNGLTIASEVARLDKYTFTDTAIATTDFATYTPSGTVETDLSTAGYDYKVHKALTGVTANHEASVVFGAVEADSGNYASIATTEAGYVNIYAKAVPASAIAIPTIDCTYKGV